MRVPERSSEHPSPIPWRLVWLFSLVGWLTMWALNAVQMYVYYSSKGEIVAWPRFAIAFSHYLLWALITPAILWYCWRHPFRPQRWRAALPRHVAAWLAVAALFVGPAHLARWLISLLAGDPTLYQTLTLASFLGAFAIAIIFYLDPFLMAHAVHYARESKSREARASQLEARLAEAQLQVLRMQLHPHFLFNTLHTISALMHRDLKAADRMLALLGDLLRDSFDKIGAQEVSLKQELDFLERYLEIERTRFHDRLVVEKELDPEALDAEVPNLILQPLVENAIRHGLERRLDAGRIHLRARREGDRLVLAVRDDGPGLPPESDLARPGGVGLANTQARLDQLYGTAHRFELVNRPEGGVEVLLSIPFKPHRAAGPGTLASTAPGGGEPQTSQATVAAAASGR